jgi:pimeloyl-ACP methyl ester carboxylesterase
VTDRLVAIDGVQLCLETFGNSADRPLLLIGGATASMDWWPTELCTTLAAAGRFVIRYDHRDTGRSEASPPGRPTYSGAELATDPLRILDALDIGSAHLVGISMGGAIAQQLAAQHADRVRSVTLIATSPAGTRVDQHPLPPMEPRVEAAFADPAPDPAWDDHAAVVGYIVDAQRPYAGALGFDEDRVRAIATTVVERTRDVAASMKNHWVAVGGESDSAPFRLADITVPALVLHGTTDPFFPLPHGEALAAELPSATLIALGGMGHEVPPPELWDIVVPAIVALTTD